MLVNKSKLVQNAVLVNLLLPVVWFHTFTSWETTCPISCWPALHFYPSCPCPTYYDNVPHFNWLRFSNVKSCLTTHVWHKKNHADLEMHPPRNPDMITKWKSRWKASVTEKDITIQKWRKNLTFMRKAYLISEEIGKSRSNKRAFIPYKMLVTAVICCYLFIYFKLFFSKLSGS